VARRNGRTVRRADPIAVPFSIEIVHTDDDDDTRAATRLAYAAADSTPKASKNGGAEVNPHHLARVEAGIKEHGWPTSAKEFAKQINMSPKNVYKVCNYLEGVGDMQRRPDKDGKPNGWDYVGNIAAAA